MADCALSVAVRGTGLNSCSYVSYSIRGTMGTMGAVASAVFQAGSGKPL